MHQNTESKTRTNKLICQILYSVRFKMQALHGTIFNSIIYLPPFFRLSSSQVIPLSLRALSFTELQSLKLDFFSCEYILKMAAPPDLHRTAALMIYQLFDFPIHSFQCCSFPEAMGPIDSGYLKMVLDLLPLPILQVTTALTSGLEMSVEASVWC